MAPQVVRQVFAGVCVAVFIQLAATASEIGRESEAAGGQVDIATATIVARHHLQVLDVADSFTVCDARAVGGADNGAALCYCFDLFPRGYVVVSAWRELPPVIAYSLTGEAGDDLGPGNPLADLLTWDLRMRLDHVALIPAEIVAQQRAAWAEYLGEAPSPKARLVQYWPPQGSTPTEGWVLTNWTQNAPYNNLCPMDLFHGARSLAGCPAVAMAQIVNYQTRFNGTSFSDTDDYYHNYQSNQFWIDNDYIARGFPSWPQLNTYMKTLFNSYFNGQTPSPTSNAALVFACGAAAHQVYNSQGSGTFGVSQALQAYQRFGCTTAVLLNASTPDLQEHLAQNMMDGYPAHLAIVDAAWHYGHNIVVDGYNTNGYFHFNFGWGVSTWNGWYQLLAGMPYEMNVIEGVVVDIMIDDCLPMDCDCDGVVTWNDFTYFAGCLSGPALSYGAPGCASFNGDGDSDVDLADFGQFQVAFGHAGK